MRDKKPMNCEFDEWVDDDAYDYPNADDGLGAFRGLINAMKFTVVLVFITLLVIWAF